MSEASKHSLKLDPAKSSIPVIDKCAIIPISAFVYTSIYVPLISFASPSATTLQNVMESHLENRIFWPVMAASSVVLAMRNRSRFGKLPPHIICLLVYLAFAGASVLWALRPETSFNRFTQEVMVVTSIVLPAMLAVDTMRGLFLCFSFGLILNVLLAPPYAAGNYGGYFLDKNALGQFTAIAFLLALHEMLYPGLRRALGTAVVVIAGMVLVVGGSKTSLGFAFFAPFLAGFTLMTRKTMRVSPMIVPLIIIMLGVFFRDRVSWYLFHDPTFSLRTVIWDFVIYEIGRSPLLGWGYQSFWLVPGSPSFVDASGWISVMPEAHNGYLDAILEMGYVGLACLVIFIMTTLHAIGPLADRDPARAWLMLSLVIFVIFHNLLESSWMHGYNLLWLVFMIVAAQVARYSQPFPLRRSTYGSRIRRPNSPGLSRAAQRSLGAEGHAAMPRESRRGPAENMRRGHS